MSDIRNLLRLTLPLAATLLAGVVAAAEPTTLLGKWMKPHMGAPLAGQDFPTLKTSLALVASKPPPGDYPRWSAIAKAGSEAAGKEDLKSVKRSCKDCHDSYKDRYKKEFPNRPFP